MTRAWVYGRVSTDEQKESGAGIAAGGDACRAYAQRQGWAIGGEFTDEGISGATGLDKRPALLEAITAMGKGDVLLVAKRDRIGRDPIAVAMIEAAVKRKGGRVVSAAGEGTDSDEPTAILMRRIVDAFAEYERLIIKARTKAGMQAKRRRGERVGQVPLGYDLADDGVKLRENAAEQEAIALVLSLRSQGISMQGIKDELNARGVQTKKPGGRWHTTSVFRLLKRSAVPIAG
jgi:DNA invertase Pin-like site-specific DNA recombinase